MTRYCISTFQDRPMSPILNYALWTVHRLKPTLLRQLLPQRVYAYCQFSVQLTQPSVKQELNNLLTRIKLLKETEKRQLIWAELKHSKSEIWGAGSGHAKPTYPLASTDYAISRNTRPSQLLSKHNIKLSLSPRYHHQHKMTQFKGRSVRKVIIHQVSGQMKIYSKQPLLGHSWSSASQHRISLVSES